jgi:hypothetical protein
MLRVGRRRASSLSFCSSLCAYLASSTCWILIDFVLSTASETQLVLRFSRPNGRRGTAPVRSFYRSCLLSSSYSWLYGASTVRATTASSNCSKSISDVTINHRRAAKLDARGVSHEERIRLGSLKGETDVTDLREWISSVLRNFDKAQFFTR